MCFAVFCRSLVFSLFPSFAPTCGIARSRRRETADCASSTLRIRSHSESSVVFPRCRRRSSMRGTMVFSVRRRPHPGTSRFPRSCLSSLFRLSTSRFRSRDDVAVVSTGPLVPCDDHRPCVCVHLEHCVGTASESSRLPR